MTNQLVEKLLNSGYLQNRAGEDGYFVPTLEELIEACGDKFILLKKHGKFWECVPCDNFGKTPKEAVANLWLQEYGNLTKKSDRV